MIPHAFARVDTWRAEWAAAGALVLLLDFDGTLAPIVDHPDAAAIPERTQRALEALLRDPTVRAAIVSGRGLADARARAEIDGIAYAGNHGMEIEGPGIHRLHPEAVAARPALERVASALAEPLGGLPGAWTEDKGMTLSIHYRLTPRDRVPEVFAAVERAAGADPTLRVTEGKMVIEVRPRTDWNKGKAVDFLLEQICPPAGAPVLYLGDDRTDEDAFATLARRGGNCEGIIVTDAPGAPTAARSYLPSPTEVASLFEALIGTAPLHN